MCLQTRTEARFHKCDRSTPVVTVELLAVVDHQHAWQPLIPTHVAIDDRIPNNQKSAFVLSKYKHLGCRGPLCCRCTCKGAIESPKRHSRRRYARRRPGSELLGGKSTRKAAGMRHPTDRAGSRPEVLDIDIAMSGRISVIGLARRGTATMPEMKGRRRRNGATADPPPTDWHVRSQWNSGRI